MIETIANGMQGMSGGTVMAVCGLGGIVFAAVITSILILTDRNDDGEGMP